MNRFIFREIDRPRKGPTPFPYCGDKMNKVVLGILVGAVLGALDGLSALISGPEVAPLIVGIVIGSTFKGVLAGVAAGFFARRYRSLPLGILFGLVVGAVLATIVAVMQHAHYLEIILPGSVVGALVGFATQRFGASPAGPAPAPGGARPA